MLLSYLGMGGSVDLRLDHSFPPKCAVVVVLGNHCLTCAAAKVITVKYNEFK